MIDRITQRFVLSFILLATVLGYCVPTNAGLNALYRFEDASGEIGATIADSTSNGYNGEVLNAPIGFSTSPLPGQSGDFSGTNGIVSADLPGIGSTLSDFGIALWMKSAPLNWVPPEDALDLSMFIAMDPPKHDAQRATVAPVVAPTNLKKLESTIRGEQIGTRITALADVPEAAGGSTNADPPSERRREPRASYNGQVAPEGFADQRFAGRDLSMGGMRIDAVAGLGVGERRRERQHGEQHADHRSRDAQRTAIGSLQSGPCHS